MSDRRIGLIFRSDKVVAGKPAEKTTKPADHHYVVSQYDDDAYYRDMFTAEPPKSI